MNRYPPELYAYNLHLDELEAMAASLVPWPRSGPGGYHSRHGRHRRQSEFPPHPYAEHPYAQALPYAEYPDHSHDIDPEQHSRDCHKFLSKGAIPRDFQRRQALFEFFYRNNPHIRCPADEGAAIRQLQMHHAMNSGSGPYAGVENNEQAVDAGRYDEDDMHAFGRFDAPEHAGLGDHGGLRGHGDEEQGGGERVPAGLRQSEGAEEVEIGVGGSGERDAGPEVEDEPPRYEDIFGSREGTGDLGGGMVE
ncbi:hypothetical protein EKO04_007162 [Ascochyta lentis]|uniref:Uncharacterized protein n=1 Tax=Ascochyta lentis TaxID=205686 RepID=A0A8H7J1Y9_9PLEO|nr:hypothetical protein EKO04_007162 [Ascochyta lentis]